MPATPRSAARAATAALGILAATVASVAPSLAGAQLAPGSTVVFSGSADASDLGSPGVLLEFDQQVRASTVGNTGAFAALNNKGAGVSGSVQNLTVGTGPQSIRSVLHLGGFRFDLTSLPSGRYGQDDCYVMPAVGQLCTPYQFPSYELSPFYLENVAATGSDAMFTAIVSFDVAGTVTGRGTTAGFTGTITAVFEGLSYQEALMGLEEFGLTDVPFTGTFVIGDGMQGVQAASLGLASASVVPEPSTVVLVGAGLLGLAGVARRRSGRA